MHEPGGPAVLRLEDQARPEPASGMVLIRVHPIGLNRSDVMVRTGDYPLHPLPSSLGFEAAGVVAGLGPGATGVAIGDRVTILPDASFGTTTYAEHVVVPAQLVVPIAPAMAFEEASALWGAALTAYNALVEFAGVTAGDHVVIPAAANGVGIAAIQFAKCAGAIPIALTRNADKAERLRSAGAAHVIETQGDVAAALHDLTAGEGARVIFDTVGGKSLAQLIA